MAKSRWTNPRSCLHDWSDAIKAKRHNMLKPLLLFIALCRLALSQDLPSCNPTAQLFLSSYPCTQNTTPTPTPSPIPTTTSPTLPPTASVTVLAYQCEQLRSEAFENGVGSGELYQAWNAASNSICLTDFSLQATIKGNFTFSASYTGSGSSFLLDYCQEDVLGIFLACIDSGSWFGGSSSRPVVDGAGLEGTVFYRIYDAAYPALPWCDECESSPPASSTHASSSPRQPSSAPPSSAASPRSSAQPPTSVAPTTSSTPLPSSPPSSAPPTSPLAPTTSLTSFASASSNPMFPSATPTSLPPSPQCEPGAFLCGDRCGWTSLNDTCCTVPDDGSMHLCGNGTFCCSYGCCPFGTTCSPLGQCLPIPEIVPGFANYRYKDCYADDTSDRSLQTYQDSTTTNTVEGCLTYARGYRYVGLEYGGQCWYGNELAPSAQPSIGCDMGCSGSTLR